MGGAAPLIRRVHTALLLVLAFLAAAPHGAAAERFDTRMVKLVGRPGDPATREHLEYCRRLGFDTVWVYSHQAGTWAPHKAPRGPSLDPEFLDLARWCRQRDLRIVVSVNPHADTGGRIVYGDRLYERAIRKFFRKLRRKAGVREVVISFDDQPTELVELSDVLRYGKSAAPAHLDLVRRIEASIPKKHRVWFCAAAYCDAHLGDGSGPYSSALLEGLGDLPERIGMVWTGPQPISPEIRREDMAATRRRLGGRELLLYDNYPVSGDFTREGLALVLGPLRQRDPDLAAEARAYLSCPMIWLGASRLPLRTVSDWLRDPTGYDPDRSWREAQRDLAGPDRRAREALRVQAMEWGGWVGTRNYRPALIENVSTLAASIGIGHVAASLSWVAKRYPERMEALRRVEDEPFRNDLLEMMARRLAVARAFPLIREYVARRDAGRDDLAPLEVELRALLESQEVASARRILAMLYAKTGIPGRVLGWPEEAP